LAATKPWHSRAAATLRRPVLSIFVWNFFAANSVNFQYALLHFLSRLALA
jgi:hypothetical protein